MPMAAPPDVASLLKQLGEQYDALKSENLQLSAQLAELREQRALEKSKADDADTQGLPIPGAIRSESPSFVSVVPQNSSQLNFFHRSDSAPVSPRASHKTSHVEAVARNKRVKELRRLKKIFGLDPHASEDVWVSAETFSKALQERTNATSVSDIKMEAIIKELNALENELPAGHRRKASKRHAPGISLGALVDIMKIHDVRSKVSRSMQHHIHSTVNALGPSVDEIVETATAGEQRSTRAESEPSWQRPLNAVVSAVVMVNVLSMAVSMDYFPDHVVWLVLEACCAVVFVFEVAVKLHHAGWQVFFRGEAWRWNVADVAIATISVLDVLLNVLILRTGAFGIGSEDGGLAQSFQVAVLFRCLRLSRLLRLVKFVNSPMLKDLANMLVGVVIGIPSLVWVLVFFVLILFVVGLVFRLALGPVPGQDLLASCGNPDDMDDFHDSKCKVHYMYGEEFFGDVPRSMFTSFRFMLGDYSSRAGKSIVVAFSQDYGARFEVLFVIFMVVAIFGLFNIITAIFVESTITGLKHNDVKRKYAQQYERSYVQKKMRQLIERTETLIMTRKAALHRSGSEVDDTGPEKGVPNVELDEEEFVDIMGDGYVTSLLGDLDIDDNPAALFHKCDADGDGFVTLNCLMEAILQLRGSAQKSDVVANSLAMRALHVKFDHLMQVVEHIAASSSSDK